MLLTIPQAANELDLSRQRVWLLVTQGRIKAQRTGQLWLIPRREIEKFERQMSGRPRKPAKG